MVIVFGWAAWYRWSTKKLIQSYNPNNDLGKKGEEARRTKLQRDSGKATIPAIELPRSPEPTERPVLETTGSDSIGKANKSDGEDSTLPGKPISRSKGIKKLFARRRKPISK